jgi:predicted RNase H-like HicB family nuclease
MSEMVSKDVKDYLGLDYAIVLQRDDEGDWVASIREMEGCIADGATPEEAIKNLESMKELWLRARLRSRRPIPLPSTEADTFSGKFLQRVPKSLHRKLVVAAEREGVSLNQFTTTVLAEAVGEKNGRLSKGAAVSLVAVPSIGPWRGSDQGKWAGHKRVPLIQRRHGQGILLSASKAPEATENPIGRELKSGDEENHKVWNS